MLTLTASFFIVSGAAWSERAEGTPRHPLKVVTWLTRAEDGREVFTGSRDVRSDRSSFRDI